MKDVSTVKLNDAAAPALGLADGFARPAPLLQAECRQCCRSFGGTEFEAGWLAIVSRWLTMTG
jgi:hypothetical protein